VKNLKTPVKNLKTKTPPRETKVVVFHQNPSEKPDFLPLKACCYWVLRLLFFTKTPVKNLIFYLPTPVKNLTLTILSYSMIVYHTLWGASHPDCENMCLKRKRKNNTTEAFGLAFIQEEEANVKRTPLQPSYSRT